jgi:hypothetical protein
MTINRQVVVFALLLALAVVGAGSLGVRVCVALLGCDDSSQRRLVQICPPDPSLRRRFFIPQPHPRVHVVTPVLLGCPTDSSLCRAAVTPPKTMGH